MKEDTVLREWVKKAAALLLAACLFCTCAAADTMHLEKEDPAFEMEVFLGYDGRMTYGKTMPVRVKVRNAGGDFEGTLAVNAYATVKEYDRYETAVTLPAGSEREIVLPVTVYARQNMFTAELLRDGKTVCAVNAEPSGVIDPSAMLIGVLSTRPRNLNNLNIDREHDTLARYEQWQTVPLSTDTFPETPAMLKSFGMIVADDIDPAELNRKQQEALDSWLRSGRILLVGGGAASGRNTAYFSGYTGLKAEGVETSESVIPALEELISRAKSGAGITSAVAVYSGGEPLCRDAEGRGLIYRTATGAGRIYTAAFETGDPALNTESLLHFFWQQLLVNLDQNLYSSILYSNSDSYSTGTVFPSEGIRVKANSGLLPGLLIMAAMIVLACALWVVLKRRDRPQWMWLVLPLAAAAAAAGILLLSLGGETNQPAAVTAENLVQDSTGAVRCYTGIAVTAPRYGRHQYSKAGETLRLQAYNNINYYEEEEEETGEPTILRTTYFLGGENTITAESEKPWDRIELTSEEPAAVEGKVDAAVWMEEDGLHAQIENRTNLRLKAGKIVTSYGFADVPALEPGGKAEALLTKRDFKDPADPVYEEGGLYLNNAGYGLYGVTNAATGSGETAWGAENRTTDTIAGMIVNAGEAINRAKGNNAYGAYENAVFLYCAEPENLPESEVSVDGKRVERTTRVALLNVEMDYTTVGRTGTMFRYAGMDLPERVETDDRLMPTDALFQNTSNQYYHNLSESPTFRFTFTGMEGVRVEELRVTTDNYYTNQAEMYALNIRTGTWDKASLNAEIRNPDNYVDEKGRLFIQFRPASQDMYADIPTPLVILEGRQTHADN